MLLPSGHTYDRAALFLRLWRRQLEHEQGPLPPAAAQHHPQQRQQHNHCGVVRDPLTNQAIKLPPLGLPAVVGSLAFPNLALRAAVREHFVGMAARMLVRAYKRRKTTASRRRD